MFEKDIEIVAETLEEAKEKLKKSLDPGQFVITKAILSTGKPKTVKADSDTVEDAFKSVQNKIPSDACVLSQEILQHPKSRVITIEALDDQKATELAGTMIKRTERVESLKMTSPGERRLFGLSKKPHTYEAMIFQPARVQVTFKSPAKIKAFIGQKWNAPKKKSAKPETPIMDRLRHVKAIYPTHSAIKVLTSPEDIKDFWREYVTTYLKNNEPYDAQKDAEAEILSALHYFGVDEHKLWFRSLPNLEIAWSRGLAEPVTVDLLFVAAHEFDQVTGVTNSLLVCGHIPSMRKEKGQEMRIGVRVYDSADNLIGIKKSIIPRYFHGYWDYPFAASLRINDKVRVVINEDAGRLLPILAHPPIHQLPILETEGASILVTAPEELGFQIGDECRVFRREEYIDYDDYNVQKFATRLIGLAQVMRIDGQKVSLTVRLEEQDNPIRLRDFVEIWKDPDS